jgi:transcriptional antiterminator NusG
MEITDTSWGLVRETTSVTGFVSAAGNKPSPLSDDEIRIILDQAAGRKPRVKYEVELDEGEPVRITSGPFASFSGIVEEIIPDKGKVKVQVTVFGRATTVELELSQVDKTV